MSDRQTPLARDVIGQLQQVLASVERQLLLLEPVRPPYQAKYEELRRLRDQLEEAFTREQAERLRQGALDFSTEVAELRRVTSDLEVAAQRAAKAREVLGHVSMAVDLVTRVLATILPFV